MRRRTFLSAITLGTAGVATGLLWPDEGFFNPCQTALPDELKKHALFEKIWQGIDTSQVWDCHVHLVGIGDSSKEIWLDPDMSSPWHPTKYLRYKFYMDGACVDKHRVDLSYIEKLVALNNNFPAGCKLMLLAFDYHYSIDGKIEHYNSPFHISNNYAAAVKNKYPDNFEWIASVHPYREDAIEELERVIQNGARAIKWLPPVMGIDASSKKCDNFYATLVKHNIPILTHTGEEAAVPNVAFHHLSNPLLFRRPMEQGVKIIMAHSACAGVSDDIDKNKTANKVENFTLFKRLLAEKAFDNNLFGEISAITQINRMGKPLEELVMNDEWHHRLVNGSDYPLPGVMPVYSLKKYVKQNYLTEYEADFLRRVRQANPILFDFSLKRLLKINNKQFSPIVFHSRRVFV